MQTNEKVHRLISYFSAGEAEVSQDTEQAIVAAYEEEVDHQSLAIKVLSVFGGILASRAFVGALFATGIYDSASGMLLFGLLCIGGSLAANWKYDRIILDTTSVSFYIIGYLMFVIGLTQAKVNDNLACVLVFAVSMSCLFIARGYILSFLSVLIANGAVLALIISSDSYNFTHVYVIFLALFCTWFFLKEASILSAGKFWTKIYDPVRTGLIFSLLAGLAFLGLKSVLPIAPNHVWISSIGIIASIIFVLFRLFEILGISKLRHKTAVLIPGLLILLSTAAAPAISGSLLIILLCFLVNHKTGFFTGIIAFVYFVCQYYYDLHFNLLTKSVLLFLTGALFLLIYLVTHKKLVANDEN